MLYDGLFSHDLQIIDLHIIDLPWRLFLCTLFLWKLLLCCMTHYYITFGNDVEIEITMCTIRFVEITIMFHNSLLYHNV